MASPLREDTPTQKLRPSSMQPSSLISPPFHQDTAKPNHVLSDLTNIKLLPPTGPGRSDAAPLSPTVVMPTIAMPTVAMPSVVIPTESRTTATSNHTHSTAEGHMTSSMTSSVVSKPLSARENINGSKGFNTVPSPPTGAGTSTWMELDLSKGDRAIDGNAKTVEFFEKRRQQLVEYHRHQLADMLVQQRAVQQQQQLCEQLTGLIAEQESVLNEHAMLSTALPPAYGNQTMNGSSLPSLDRWQDGMSVSRDAMPLHSTSVHIPIPSDTEDPNTMGNLAPTILDDGLDMLLDGSPVHPPATLHRPITRVSTSMDSKDRSDTSLPGETDILPSSPLPGASDKAHLSPSVKTDCGPDTVDRMSTTSKVSSNPSHSLLDEAVKSSRDAPAAAASSTSDTFNTPPASPILAASTASAARSSQEASAPMSFADLQSLNAQKSEPISAEGVREGQLLTVVGALNGELKQCKRQLHNSLQVQRIQASALQTLWQEIQELRKSQEAMETSVASVVSPMKAQQQTDDGQSSNMSMLAELCEQLQTQVEFLEDRVSALSGSVFVAGETRQRLKRLGFGVEEDDEEKDQDGYGLAHSVVLTDQDDLSTSSLVASDAGSDLSDVDSGGETDQDATSIEKCLFADCPEETDGMSEPGSPNTELSSSFVHCPARHTSAFTSPPPANTPDTALARKNTSVEHGNWMLTVRHWAANDVLLKWVKSDTLNSSHDSLTGEGREGSSSHDDGILGYRLAINGVPVIPMIPAPASQVLVSGLDGDRPCQLSVNLVHIEGETLLASPVDVSMSAARPLASSPSSLLPPASPASPSLSPPSESPSPRCSSTHLSPQTPRLKINYKHLKNTECRAVLGTLHHSDIITTSAHDVTVKDPDGMITNTATSSNNAYSHGTVSPMQLTTMPLQSGSGKSSSEGMDSPSSTAGDTHKPRHNESTGYLHPALSSAEALPDPVQPLVLPVHTACEPTDSSTDTTDQDILPDRTTAPRTGPDHPVAGDRVSTDPSAGGQASDTTSTATELLTRLRDEITQYTPPTSAPSATSSQTTPEQLSAKKREGPKRTHNRRSPIPLACSFKLP